MNRVEFRRQFGAQGPVVLPVIHVLAADRTLANVRVVEEAGAHGCFLINHDFKPDEFLPIIRAVRAARPELWLGINFLAVTGRYAFPMLADLLAEGVGVDAYWADDACIDELGVDSEADEIAAIRSECAWRGLYFGGTCFKKQREVLPEHYASAAREAVARMDVVTTSGIATGQEADLGKIACFREAIGEAPLALASGITPDNARTYADVDCFMVATGINYADNFYDIDPARLAALMAVSQELGEVRSV